MPEDNMGELKTGNEILETDLDSYDPPEGSALKHILGNYLSPEGKGEGGDTVNYLDEIKDLPETDKLNLTDFFGQEEWKAEDLLEKEFGDAAKEKLIQFFPEVFSKDPEIKGEESFNGDLEGMEKEALIVELKKHQVIAHDRELKLTDANKQIEVLESKEDTTGEESEVQKDLGLLADDFLGNYDKVKSKYNLPSLTVVREQLSKGGVIARIKQWQESYLIPFIEKEFKLEKDEFEYDSNEAAKAGTASFMWNDLTDSKRIELRDEQTKLVTQENEQALKVEEQQKTDIKWYADTYTKGNQEETQKLITKMNETITDIGKGKASEHEHPFAMRNLLRGFYFDNLVETAVTNAIADLNDQYVKKGIHLPDNDFPTDVTKLKGNPRSAEIFTKDILDRSPMFASINRTLNVKK